MKTKTLFKFLGALLVSLISCIVLAAPVADYYQITPTQAFTNLVKLDLAANLVVGGITYFTRQSFRMPGSVYAIQKEIWVDYIIENLFKDNSFVTRSFNEGDYVLNGVVVHIPQAGSKRNVVKNRLILPATVVQRADVDIVYPLDEFTTDPVFIPNADKVELSYDKISSVLAEDMAALKEAISDWLLYYWGAEASTGIVRTTGGAGAATVAAVGAQTGTRKKFVKEDLKKVRFLMNKQNISKENRIALLPSDFLEQLQDDADLMKRDMAKELDMKNGVIDRLFGFDIIERSEVLTYDNTGTPVRKLPGAEGAAADNLAALVYQQNCVARAMGTVDAFEDLKSPTMYGDVYSFLTRMGGRKRRSAGEGVFSIVQAA